MSGGRVMAKAKGTLVLIGGAEDREGEKERSNFWNQRVISPLS